MEINFKAVINFFLQKASYHVYSFLNWVKEYLLRTYYTYTKIKKNTSGKKETNSTEYPILYFTW